MTQIDVNDQLYADLMAIAEQNNQSLDDFLQSVVRQRVQQTIESRLQLLELAADAVITIDESGMIITANVGAEKLFGYQPSELIGQQISVLIPDEVRSYHQNNVTGFIQSDTTARYMADRQPLDAIKKNGQTFRADISLAQHMIDGHNYVTAIIRDVSMMQMLIEQLQEKEARLRLMTTHATDLICLHDPDGIYEFVSDAAYSVIGFAPSDLLGQSPYDYFHPDDIPDIQQNHVQTRAGNPNTRITYRFRKASGDYVWLESITKPVRNDEGDVVNLVTVSRDVTDARLAQIELQYERDLISSIMELSPSAITVVSNTGQITIANKRASEVLGITKDTLETRTYNAPDWKHTDYDGNLWSNEKQPFVRVMATGEPVWDVRHAIEKPDGERVYLAINGMPMFDDNGEIERIIFTVEDYTERKLQQDELEAALAREKQLNRMKSQFLSIVSHEFKTPLSIILTSTGLIRLKLDMMSKEQLMARIVKIENQVQRLNELINDVTFINKQTLVEQKLKPSPLHLGTFFDELIRDLAPNYANLTDVTIMKPEKPVIIEIDHQIAHFIFDNLISNAMKYSGEDGQVMVHYSLQDAQLTVLISDNGIGIPEEDQVDLFELFHRASNVGKIKGTGLGLSIVKSCVDTLQGSMTFESVESQGTKFIVTLPVTVISQIS